MGETTGIAWASRTWNWAQGCRKKSPGCKHCFMYREKARYKQDPTKVVRSAPPTFNAPLKWQREAQVTRTRSLVFTGSWFDFFEAEADPWRGEAWDIIRRCPDLTFQVLTKNAERIADHLPADWGDGWPNVWLGVSVEDQEWADRRVPHLLRIPARVRFLSVEPQLGPIEFSDMTRRADAVSQLGKKALTGIHWVIVGGESGPHARPFDLAWARSIRDQCRAAEVAFFAKQLGAHVVCRNDEVSDWFDECGHLDLGHVERFQGAVGRVYGFRHPAGADPAEWPADLRVQEFPETRS